MSIEPDPLALTGDDEPEDGWDRNDPPDQLVDNLRRRVVLLARIDNLGERDRLRISHLLEDLLWLRERLRDE